MAESCLRVTECPYQRRFGLVMDNLSLKGCYNHLGQCMLPGSRPYELKRESKAAVLQSAIYLMDPTRQGDIFVLGWAD